MILDWTVSTTHDGHRVLFLIDTFSISPTELVSFYDGPDSSSPLMGSLIAAATVPSFIVSTDTHLHIVYSCDDSLIDSGFSARALEVPKGTLLLNTGLNLPPADLTISSQYYILLTTLPSYCKIIKPGYTLAYSIVCILDYY